MLPGPEFALAGPGRPEKKRRIPGISPEKPG